MAAPVMTAPPARVLASVARLPDLPGVYRFRDARDRVLYVGRATNLRQRVRSYWGELRGRRHLARMVSKIARIEAVACASVHEAAWLERNLLTEAKPRWNRSRGGEEVPTYIRLGSDLTVVTEARYRGAAGLFGPYLGGGRTRLAVAGLRRVLPLVDAAAVLERDPAAIAAAVDALRARRDRAADNLAFEFAGQVQRELEALDWVTCAQRVTVPGAGGFDVFGWHDGVLVHFRAEDGRLRRWEALPSSEADAAPHVAATPGAWREFADRSAMLAAALASPA